MVFFTSIIFSKTKKLFLILFYSSFFYLSFVVFSCFFLFFNLFLISVVFFQKSLATSGLIASVEDKTREK